jgi:hypothetical protein
VQTGVEHRSARIDNRRVPRSQSDSAKLRRRLVRELDERGVIRSDLVRDAFLAVPREAFLPEFVAREGLEAVYRDDAIPTKFAIAARSAAPTAPRRSRRRRPPEAALPSRTT